VQEFAADLGTFIEANKVWAGVIMALVAFGESTIIVGVIIPATPFLLLIGGLIASGVIDPLPVLLGAFTGAVAGDFVGYLLGRRFGPGLVYRWPLSNYREGIARARLFFRRYGFAAVFFGRFFGPVRCTIPVVAGMMGMDSRRFQLANMFSAAVWAPVMIAPGFLAVHGLMEANIGTMSETGWLGLAVFMTLGGTVAAVVGVKFLGKRPRRRHAGRGLEPAKSE